MIGAEGSDGKTSPPFWHPSFDSSEVIFGSDLLKCRSPLAFVLHFLFILCRRFFWFGPFERSKPLGVRFVLIVPFVPKVFGFGPFERSKSLGVRLISMQSLRILHTLLTYYFMQHVDAGRSLPFGLLRRM